MIIPSRRQSGRPGRDQRWAGALLAGATVVFLVLSRSDDHFWDEFFYVYSVRFHTLPELIRFERVSQLFPAGFFSGKLGHLVLLSGLTGILRGGVASLAVIQGVYALLLLGFFAAAYGCLRELLGRDHARDGTLVLAFSPLALYLGFKALSEVPSLLFTSLGCWAFLRSFHSNPPGRSTRWLVAAAAGVGLGTVCRITGIVTFGALGVALLFLGDERFDRPRLLARLGGVGVAAVALQVIALVLAGGSYLQYDSDVYTVVTTHPPVQRLYAIVLFVQAFALVLPFAWRRGERGVGLAAIWLTIAALPFLAGHEPRYYAPALLPFAIVAAAGFRGAGDLLFGNRLPWGPALLLATLVLFNRFVLIPLMPFEVQQSRLLHLFQQVRARDPGGTYLIPWASDYSLLRVSFPDLPIELCLSSTPESRYAASDTIRPMTPEDQWWAGRDHYVASREELSRRSPPWIYIGWTYNPAELRLMRLLSAVDLSRLSGLGGRSLHNHLAGSWVWYDRSVTLAPTDTSGQYQVFRVF
jgi:hypothetical protein